jgi:hypothetical protein
MTTDREMLHEVLGAMRPLRVAGTAEIRAAARAIGDKLERYLDPSPQMWVCGYDGEERLAFYEGRLTRRPTQGCPSVGGSGPCRCAVPPQWDDPRVSMSARLAMLRRALQSLVDVLHLRESIGMPLDVVGSLARAEKALEVSK